MEILLGFLLGVPFAVICVLLANSKGRNPWLWGILGFFFGIITLIVIAVLPSTRPSRPDGETSPTGGVQRCPQCAAENPGEGSYCTNCGAALGLEPEVASPGFAPARFITPLVGLIVGLVFALIFLQAIKPSTEAPVAPDGTQEDFERARDHTPPVVFLWPVSDGVYSFKWPGKSAKDLVWTRFPTTLANHLVLAVLVAWRGPGGTGGLAVLVAWRYWWPGGTGGLGPGYDLGPPASGDYCWQGCRGRLCRHTGVLVGNPADAGAGSPIWLVASRWKGQLQPPFHAGLFGRGSGWPLDRARDAEPGGCLGNPGPRSGIGSGFAPRGHVAERGNIGRVGVRPTGYWAAYSGCGPGSGHSGCDH